MVALGIVFVLAIVAFELTWSPRYVRRIEARIAAGDPDARRALYRFSIAFEWPMAAIAAAITVAGFGVARLGLTVPNVDVLAKHGSTLIGALIGAAFATAFTIVRRGKQGPKLGNFDAMIPRTPAERRWFAALALTAGVTEEIAFRVLPLAVLATLAPSLPPIACVAIAAVAFGLAHAYQGIVGVLATAVLGGVFGAIFVETGSIVPCMVLHALVDLRILLL